MKKFVIPMVMLASLSVYAGEKGNGGETTDVNGIPRLRDLVENTTCNWVNGQAMVRENRIVDSILNRLSAVDWYFAEDLRQEIFALDFCLTSKLRRVNTKDIESFVTVYDLKTEQAAIRFNQSVYLDFDHFILMPEEDRGFLIIHEAMHSYLPQWNVMRNQNVRSMVKAIEGVYQGRITSTESFHLQLENNQVEFPATSRELYPVKTAVIYLLGNYETRRQIILSQTSVGNFIKQEERINPYLLAEKHRSAFQTVSINEIIHSAIMMEDIEVLGHLFKDSKEIKERALITLLSSDFAKTSKVLQEFLAQAGTTEAVANDILKELASKTVSRNENERIAVSGMEVFTGVDSRGTDFTSLNLPNLNSLSPKAKLVLDILTSAIETKNTSLLQSVFLANEVFYKAFRVQELKAELKNGPAYNEMERDVAIRKVDLLVKNFWALTKEYVSMKVGSDDWKDFIKQIDANKLGYEIK